MCNAADCLNDIPNIQTKLKNSQPDEKSREKQIWLGRKSEHAC